jgi:uncharacterized protein YjiS (DUF1127 family)
MAHAAAKTPSITSILLSPLMRLIAARRDRRRVHELLQLSDSLLRDIGLTRFDVQCAMTKSGSGAASAALAEVAKARVAANTNPLSERFELKAA